ncbi:hypothetical protein [Ramlibacter sp.]|uniref:hypothetical protein n=1 Tax=Ramlibacter sp. TaxID=1917967 RepID=UPI001810096D|nr:hypothetical protein [Ramlibacter sp.]MBA2674835.1 hypothetical protein [Ramlibacter sp.]
MEAPLYHVLLEGQRVGPYDRRTIVGMRIKNTLTSGHVLVAGDGSRSTVADLVKLRPRDNTFQPNRSGSYSVVQATYSASVVEVAGRGPALPPFKGEVETRVQNEVLRIAGRLRHGLGWKDGRVKLPLNDILHARLRGTLVDLGLRIAGDSGLQRLTLELFTSQAAKEFVQWLPAAKPWPDAEAAAPPTPRSHLLGWATVIGTAVAIGLVMVVVLTRH